MATVPSGHSRQGGSLSPKYRLALRLKNGKPHQSPSAQNRKIGSDCSFHASELLENCSFSDRDGTRITLSIISFAVRKDMHRGTSARHRDVKLCFVRLAERPNRHVDDDL